MLGRSGAGATLAQQCAICHGAEGISAHEFSEPCRPICRGHLQGAERLQDGRARERHDDPVRADAHRSDRCGTLPPIYASLPRQGHVGEAPNIVIQWCAAPEHSALRLLPWRARSQDRNSLARGRARRLYQGSARSLRERRSPQRHERADAQHREGSDASRRSTKRRTITLRSRQHQVLSVKARTGR